MIQEHKYDIMLARLESGYAFDYEEFVYQRFDLCLDEVAQKVRYSPARSNMAWFIQSLNTLLLGNRSITYRQYEKTFTTFETMVKEAKDEEEINEGIVDIFRTLNLD